MPMENLFEQERPSEMKRFTETSKWSDPWFRRLSPEMKLLWQWLLDNCDNAGVIEPDLELASFQIGYQYPIDTLSNFGDRLIGLDSCKWFIPKFIGFQYGELSRDCKAHNPIFASIEKHNLERLIKGYPKGMHTPQEKEKEKEEEKEQKETPNKLKKPTHEEIKIYCAKSGIPEKDADWFFHKCEANGWTNGGKPIKSWQHTLASWRAAGYLPSQKAPAINQTRPLYGSNEPKMKINPNGGLC